MERVRPDVMCLHETKPQPLRLTRHGFEGHGYNLAYTGHGAYNGVAIASLHPISRVVTSGSFGDEHLDRETRLIACISGSSTPIRIVSLYVPHGREVGHWHYEYKLAFLERLADRVRDWVAEGHVMLAGDVNVAASDSDIFHPDAFVGLTHVTPRERQGWKLVLDAGFVDVDAARWGADQQRFTWWNHGLGYSRNLRIRIDVIAADPDLAERGDTTWIDHLELKLERPSDHAALVADFVPFTTR